MGLLLPRARARDLSLPLALALSLSACGACDDPFPLACESNDDCPAATACTAGACLPTPIAEGEGDVVVAEGEGDLDVAEGEGDAGEGEGDAAEGEGDAGEGEGDAGEGEGGEGEGEGEGDVVDAVSCLDLHQRDPSAPSGVYTLSVSGTPRDVECDMDTSGGGWGLLLRFDDGDACPGQWIDAPVGGCRREIDAPQTSAFVASPYAWAEMRGEVRGFGFGGSDGFNTDTFTDIDGVYVDGLTFTRGLAPREHVFTFVHGDADDFNNPSAMCPCAGGRVSPAFVGASYVCEDPQSCTGTPRRYDTNDVLFDGLLIDTPACQGAAESAPSFDVTLASARDDDLEMRLMGSAAEGTLNEDLAVTHMELWVR